MKMGREVFLIVLPFIALLSQAAMQSALALDRQPVLPLALAQEAASTAVAACAAKGYRETVVVVDADGVQRVLLRGDGAGAHSLESAFRKAYTAASFGQPTSRLREQIAADPDATGLQHLDHIILVGGGVPIRVDGVVIAAIGAAGAPGVLLDEACAQAGIDQIKDRLK